MMNDGLACVIATLIVLVAATLPALLIATLIFSFLLHLNHPDIGFFAFILLLYSCTRWSWYIRTSERWDKERWWPYKKQIAER